ncbi:Retrovirus-related Pol polyprotein from transposon RE2 [Bienertia sinuspersici]
MASSSSSSTGLDPTNPLYLYPSDGNNLVTVEQLKGASNYRTWKRSMEISLASKRKIGFVTGAVRRDPTDRVKQDHWDTCNNMVISWIIGNMSDTIKKSIMLIRNAVEMWKQLENRFTLSNELEDLRDLPVVSDMNTELSSFIGALIKEQEEQKLFKCSLQQEENQRDALKAVKEEPEPLAMMSKSSMECTACGKKGHVREKCWTIVGYPSWFEQKDGKGKKESGPAQGRGGSRGGRAGRGRLGRGGGRFAGNTQTKADSSSSSTPALTAEQIEQLMKLLPTLSKAETQDGDDDMEVSYAGMVSCNLVKQSEMDWVIDSGATDYITGTFHLLKNVMKIEGGNKINLPNGQGSVITHYGTVSLKNGIELRKVLYVPNFKNNLVSVQRLAKDDNYNVIFHSKFCVINQGGSKNIKVVGKEVDGLYYLVNQPLRSVLKMLKQVEGREETNECKEKEKGAGDLRYADDEWWITGTPNTTEENMEMSSDESDVTDELVTDSIHNNTHENDQSGQDTPHEIRRHEMHLGLGNGISPLIELAGNVDHGAFVW